MKIAMLFLSFFMFHAAHAKTHSLDEIDQVISVLDLSQDSIMEFATGMHPNSAIACQEGSSLPFHFLFRYKICSAFCNPNLILKIEKPFYLRIAGKKMYISFDLIHWENAKRFFSGQPIPKATISPDKSSILIETTILNDD